MSQGWGISIIREMFLREDRIDEIVKGLGYAILVKKILISRSPLYALALGKEGMVLVEILEDANSELIAEHTFWIEDNYSAFVSKFKVPLCGENRLTLNLLCFYTKNDRLDFQLSPIIDEVRVFQIELKEEKWIHRPFFNFTVNLNALEEAFEKVSQTRVRRKAKKLFLKKMKFKPVVCKKLAEKIFMIQTLKEKSYFYVQSNFIFYHSGKAPFRPYKIV